MLTIGALATLAGTTARAIRHYHAVGVLPEPARRVNGYREYDLADAVRLIRVRRLVELGLSLAEVGDALGAGSGDPQLRAVLVELDTDLAGQERLIAGRRRRLAELLARPGDVAASEEVVQLLRQVSAAVPQATPGMLVMERELLEMVEAMTEPDRFAEFAEQYVEALADPVRLQQMAALGARFEALAEVDRDDPRVDALAREMADVGVDQWPHDTAPDDSWQATWSAFLVTLPAAQRRCMERAWEWRSQWMSPHDRQS